jgi:hypothetical protein
MLVVSSGLYLHGFELSLTAMDSSSPTIVSSIFKIKPITPMKKIVIILLLSICSNICLAQPTTMLPDGMFIPKVSALTTCSSINAGKMVYLESNNKLYVCNGTAWENTTQSGFSLPFSATVNSASTLLSLINSSSSSGGVIAGGIGNGLNNDYAIYGYTYGTGAAARFYSGNSNAEALQTYGKLKIQGNSEGAGKVLTSDASGNATWQQAINHGVAFAVRGLSAAPGEINWGPGTIYADYPRNTYTKLNFRYNDYDQGNDFDLDTDTFTAPLNGIYHFDVSLKQLLNSTQGQSWCSVSFWTDTNYKHTEIYCTSEVSQSAMLSTDIRLLAGMTVMVKVYPVHDTYPQTFYRAVELARFSGHLVTRL